MDLPGSSTPLVDTTDFSCKKKSHGRPAGFRDPFFYGLFQFRPEPVEAVFSLGQFFLKLGQPPRMREITGADDRDPLFLGPIGEFLRNEVTGGSPGEVRVGVEVGDECHGPDYFPEGPPCQS